MKTLIPLFCSMLLAQLAVGQSTTVTIQTDPTFKDAVIESYNQNLNGGTDEMVFVAAWTNGSSSNNKRYFFEIDLSFIPANAIVDSAKISFFHGTAGGAGTVHQGNNSWSIRRVTQSWNEHLINWLNQPSSTPTNKSVVPATVSGTQNFPNIDITNLVEDARQYGNFGFVAILEDETSYKRVILCSSDHSNVSKRPQIEITYRIPCALVPDFSFTFMAGNTVVFNDLSTATAPNTYLWDFGDGTFSNQKNPTKTFNQSGTYTVCLTITNACDTTTVCKTVSLCSPAQSNFIYGSNGHQIQFQAQPNNALSYWWDFGDGNYSALKNPTYTYSVSGNYLVCLAITDSCGTDTTCKNIGVYGIGINENQVSPFTIYPNPSQGIFNLKGEINTIESVTIYSLHGQKINAYSAPKESIDLGPFASGMYIIQLKTSQGYFYHKVQKL